MKAVKAIAFILVGLIAAASLTLIIINMVRQDDQTQTVNSFIDRQDERYAESQKKEDEFIEDGAVIGDIYTIKSTTAISDAYKNGQDPSKLSEEDKKTYDLAVKALDEATKGCTTDYEKELGIFTWLAENIPHGNGNSTMAILTDETFPMDTPYGVLSGKSAVCVGYATTFRLLVNMIGLECHIPHNESHSWDLVQLDDGEWYYVDIYSAANSSSPDYSYFNMNQRIASEQEDLSMCSSLPKANGKKYLYAVINSKPGDDFYAIPKVIKKNLKSVAKGNESMISVKLNKTPTEEELALSEAMTEAIIARMKTDNPKLEEYYGSCKWYKDENDKLVYALYFTNNSYYDNVDLTKPEAKKMQEILDEVFGKGISDMFSDTEGTDGDYTETSTYNYAA